jgi:hypothetical protein
MKVDVLGSIGTDVDWNDHRFRNNYLASIRTFDRHAKITTATSTIRSSKLWKPGDTCTTISGRYSSTISKPFIDHKGLGRFSGFILHRKHNRKLLIISAYQVCQKHICEAGVLTAYHQQHLINKKRAPKPETQSTIHQGPYQSHSKRIKKWNRGYFHDRRHQKIW